MIYIRSKGRLGNQLFIYSFARRLSLDFNQGVRIYTRKDENDPNWYCHLDGYQLPETIQLVDSKREIYKMVPVAKALYYYDRVRIHGMSPFQRQEFQRTNLEKYLKQGLFLYMDGYIEVPESIPKNLFCDGYFQSSKYFDKYRNVILKDLLPKDKRSVEEEKFLDKIKGTESVCLTIRLGDYINNTTHQVCTKKFYLDAMRKMKELVPNCVFFVFSDEVGKAREIFDFEYPVIYDSGKSTDVQSLDIMRHCKHFIISNSSFSWWAQYLSTNPNKIVLAPDKWYAHPYPCDIMQDNWTLLGC